jgi:hypothetical protein
MCDFVFGNDETSVSPSRLHILLLTWDTTGFSASVSVSLTLISRAVYTLRTDAGCKVCWWLASTSEARIQFPVYQLQIQCYMQFIKIARRNNSTSIYTTPLGIRTYFFIVIQFMLPFRCRLPALVYFSHTKIFDYEFPGLIIFAETERLVYFDW